jgi:hypothetical protein
MGVRKLLVIVLVVAVLIVLTPLTLLGLVPGLSPLVGAGQKDLGIKVTSADSAAVLAKLGTQVVSTTSGDFKLEGKKDVALSLDSKELSANSNNKVWKNYPLKNVQIRINSDGTVEGSAILVVSKLMPYAVALGYSESQIKDAMNQYHIPQVEVPIYLMGKGSVINDKVSVEAQVAKIGAIALPSDILAKGNDEAQSVLDDVISKHSANFHAESLTFSDGKMNFKGYLPEKGYVVTE